MLDCEAQSFLHSIDGLPGVAGVLVDEEHDLLFTTDRAAARVSIFCLSNEELLGRVEVGAHPNGLAYDRNRGRLYAFNLGDPPRAGCTVTFVDLASMAVLGTYPLPGRPRWALYDEERDVVFANIREPSEVLVIDAEEPGSTRSFAVPSPGPHGLWLHQGRLFCAADNGALVVLDADNGKVLSELPLPGVPDVVMHDPELERLYVAVGDPAVVCSFDSARLEQLETIRTEAGAHTMVIDPVAHMLFVFCPESSRALLYAER